MKYIDKLLDPKIDYVFKRIFGYVGNEEITKGLISSIIQKEISNVKLDNNTILEKDLLGDKVGILDIRAKIEGKINCNIEMQIVDRKNIEKRILYYWSKLYSMNLKEGKDYESLEKVIVILITDYEIESLKEIEKYQTKRNIREEEYQKVILTEVMEFYIIELPKYEKYKEKNKNEKLNRWIKFIKEPGGMEMGEDKVIQKAKEVLEEISQDERERYLAELREKYILDQKAIEDAGYDKGLKDGMSKGKSLGIIQGHKERNIEIAKYLLKLNMSIEQIKEVTGLTEEEIKKLK